MEDTVPTIKIHAPGDSENFIVINESDFDPKTHKKWEEKEKPAADEHHDVKVTGKLAKDK